MRWLVFVTLVVLGCSNPPNCFEPSGTRITQDIPLAPFESITVHDDITLVLANGSQQVLLTTGENLAPDVEFVVTDQRLTIRNNNSCNWTRDYEKTIVQIFLPDFRIVELLGFGSLLSSDTLRVENMRIISLDSPSDVDLSLSGNELHISSNNASNFSLRGSLEYLDVGFYYGNGILFASKLKAEVVTIDHRGSNTMHTAPQQSISGQISGFGDVMLYSQPTVIELDQSGEGEVIQVN